MFYDEYESGQLIHCKQCGVDRPTCIGSDGSTADCEVCGYSVEPLDLREEPLRLDLREAAAVAEFRHLDEEIATDQWRQAELTWTIAAPRGDHGRMPIAVWARAVGKGTDHIATLWRMWDDIRGCLPADLPPFNETYQRTREGEDYREKQARRRATSAVGKLPLDEQADLVGRLLVNPDVARLAMTNTAAASSVVGSAPLQIAEAQLRRHEEIRDRVPPFERERRDQAETRYQVLEAIQRLTQVRLAVAKLPDMGMITEAEREMLVDEASRTLPTVQFLASLTREQASLADDVAEFLRGQA